MLLTSKMPARLIFLSNADYYESLSITEYSEHCSPINLATGKRQEMKAGDIRNKFLVMLCVGFDEHLKIFGRIACRLSFSPATNAQL